MDRTQINIAKAQVGFIGVIVLPAYENFSKFLPHVEKNIEEMKQNKEKWATLVDDYQKKLEAAKETMKSQNHMPTPIEEAD